MEGKNYFEAIVKLTLDLREFEKKQLALILIGQTLTEISESEAHQISRDSR